LFISRDSRDGIDLEIAMQYNDSYQEQIFTFRQQHQHTRRRNAPDRFKSALTRTLNNYAVPNNLFKEAEREISSGETSRGSVCVISVKLPNPQFEGQTKTKLGNSEVKGIVETWSTMAWPISRGKPRCAEKLWQGD
jgi:DNA gyrase subunit B